jgi:methylmalonyl-CoA mutase
MSAVLGGCSTLYVSRFDESLEKDSSQLSIRMARNQQLILKEESYLNKASDIGAGSYYIESLTEQLGTKAFELFKRWEAQGGFISCLEKGTIQKEVNEQAALLKNKVASGEMVIIGVNKFINPKDEAGAVKAKAASASNQLFEPIKALRLAEVAEPANTTAR